MPDNEYADGMLEHDGDVGLILKALDDFGIADNTIVIYTKDNGPLFHFLEHLYLFGIACRIGELVMVPRVTESLIFKKTGKFWYLVVRDQPFVVIGAFNLIFFISHAPLKSAAEFLNTTGKRQS
jgi:arylsulfatase A-like enzyme